jgi:hypothetical protein
MKGAPILLAAAMAFAGGAMSRAADPGGVDAALVASDAVPRVLSEFGFFTDPAAQVAAPGVVPYRLNTALYSDGADKLRFVWLPAGAKMRGEGAGLLQFPIGTALIKTFAFGEGDGRRLIETRVLLHRAEGWVALPYLWNEDQSEAGTGHHACGRGDQLPRAQQEPVQGMPRARRCGGADRAEGAQSVA